MVKKSSSVRVESDNYRQLAWIARRNKMRLSLAKVANLCIDRGLPVVLKELKTK